jgi:hypothetical protein
LRSRGGYPPVMMAGMGKCYEVSIEEQGWIPSCYDGRHGQVLRAHEVSCIEEQGWIYTPLMMAGMGIGQVLR